MCSANSWWCATSPPALLADVFMEGGEERNLIVFRRDAEARIEGLIERRKFNDLFMRR
jgi:hypothetical protein